MAANPASKPVTLPVAGSLRENNAPWSVPPRISLPRCLIVSAQEPAGIAAASATGDPAITWSYPLVSAWPGTGGGGGPPPGGPAGGGGGRAVVAHCPGRRSR